MRPPPSTRHSPQARARRHPRHAHDGPSQGRHPARSAQSPSFVGPASNSSATALATAATPTTICRSRSRSKNIIGSLRRSAGAPPAFKGSVVTRAVLLLLLLRRGVGSAVSAVRPSHHRRAVARFIRPVRPSPSRQVRGHAPPGISASCCQSPLEPGRSESRPAGSSSPVNIGAACRRRSARPHSSFSLPRNRSDDSLRFSRDEQGCPALTDKRTVARGGPHGHGMPQGDREERLVVSGQAQRFRAGLTNPSGRPGQARPGFGYCNPMERTANSALERSEPEQREGRGMRFVVVIDRNTTKSSTIATTSNPRSEHDQHTIRTRWRTPLHRNPTDRTQIV
jgi:hypothetical protein